MLKDGTKNPLNDFVDETASSTSLKLPPLPKLSEHFKEKGNLMEAMRTHDEEMQSAWEHLERILNERVQGKQPVSGGNLT